MDTISGFDFVDEVVLEDDSRRLGQKAWRGVLRQLLNHHLLEIPEGAQAVFEGEWVVVLIPSSYESSFIRLEVLLRIKVIGILFYVKIFGLLTPVNTFL